MKSDENLQLSTLNASALGVSASPAIAAEEAEGVLDFGRLVRSIARGWWIVAGVMVATTAAASLKVVTDTPEYVGRFEVLVQPGSAETEVIANIPEALSSNGQAVRPLAVDDDLLKILKSPAVLEPTIDAVQSRYPDVCQVPEALVGSAEAVDAFCYESIANRLMVNAVKDSLDKNSTIVEVTFRDSNPEVVRYVMNEISQAYLDYSLETKQADIRRGIEFVEKKTPDLRNKVETLQTQLQDLRLQNDIIDPVSRARQLADQVGVFSKEQLEVEVQLEQTRSVADDLRQQLLSSQGKAASSSALNDNPRYQSLLNGLLELDAEIAEASTLYLDTAPEMEVLQEQRQNLLQLLESEGEQSQREVVSQIRQLESREQALNRALQGLNSDVDQLTGVTRSYDDIQRDLTIATENLNQFIAKREALEIDAAQREIPWELVTPPSLPRPVSTSLLKYLLLGGTLGLLLGIGIVLMLDQFSSVIYSEDDIKRSTRLPVLGTIPAYSAALDTSTLQESPASAKQYAGVAVGGDSGGAGRGNGSSGGMYAKSSRPYSQDPFAEAFRSLYTNIRLLNSQHPVRSIAISSVMPSEGKSTVAIHLADAAAAMGQRVLLIDADLRNPQLHNYLELPNEKGLTNLFSGEVNPAVIQKFSPDSNLYVMTAGSVPFEPNRLFSSASMRQFTDQIEPKFDLVIYDTTPLLGLADAYLVANNADGLLLVTQPGKLKQGSLDRVMEQLRTTDIRLLGVVTREK